MHESMKDLPIEKLLAYFARRRAGFAERSKGASEEKIREFERLVGRPLPPDYRIFLRTVGRDCGDMFKGESSSSPRPFAYDFSLETALKERRRFKTKLEKNPRLAAKNYFNPAFVMIGTQSHCQDRGSYFLDTRAPGESPVVNIEDTHELRVVASSFRDFIFRFVFSGERF